ALVIRPTPFPAASTYIFPQFSHLSLGTFRCGTFFWSTFALPDVLTGQSQPRTIEVEVTMRRLFPMVVPLVMLLVACTPSPQPPPGTSTSSTTTVTATTNATAEPSPSPSTVPKSGTTGDGEPLGDGDEPGRYAYRCTSLDASPEVQLSSLAEVWAATNYTRMEIG